MKSWLLLGGAIVTEVIGTLTLRATIDHPAWIAMVVVSYLTSFWLLGITLRTGMPIGVIYGIWGAVGVSLVAVLGVVLFGETLSILAITGIGIIVVGVVVIETGAHHASASEVAEK